MRQTIEAQELCGEHVGRLVQFTLHERPAQQQGAVRDRPIVIAGELEMIWHSPQGVRLQLRGAVYGNRPDMLAGQLELQPTDRVAVDAFEVVVSR